MKEMPAEVSVSNLARSCSDRPVLGSRLGSHCLVGVSYPLFQKIHYPTELNQGSGLFPTAALKFSEFSSGTRAKRWMCGVFLLHKFGSCALV